MNDEHEIRRFQLFRTTTGGALRSTLSVPTQYNSQRAPYRSKNEKLMLESELEAVLSKASTLFPGCKSENCTWDDVFEQIDAANAAYETKAPKGSFRNFIRGGKADARTLDSLCSIIPEEQGLGVLRGGLSFIFQAWEQRIENREKILELLADVVDTLKTTAEMYKIFRDGELKAKTYDLYGIIVDSLKLLIEMLLRCRKEGSQYEAVVLEGLDYNIQNAKAGVTMRVDILSAQSLEQIRKTTSAIDTELHVTRAQVHKVSQGVRLLDGETKTLNRGISEVLKQGTCLDGKVDVLDEHLTLVQDNVMKTCKEMKEDNKQGFLRMSDCMSTMVSKNEVAAMIQTELYKLLASETVYRSRQPVQQTVRAEVIAKERRLTQRTFSVTIEELLLTLHVDLGYLSGETEHILRQSNSLRPKGLGKARWLLTTAQFKNWLSQPFSGILLVDGYCKDDGIGKISPLSVLCASLATTLVQTSSNIVLRFFCSSHTRVEQDTISGPSGLLRSLITQLILYPGTPDIDLDPMEQGLYDAVSQCNVLALVSLFGSIVCNMDKSITIICVIDGISDFETPLRGWDREILGVVDQLQNLVYNQRSGPTLKLLMTSANKALNIGSLLRRDRGEYVSLRSGNVSDKPVRGFGFDRDVGRMLMPSSQESSFLEPGGWGAQRASQREFAYVGRPRSSGSNVPGG
ncbi:hypothetical protein J4E81_008912 [Alternaria sp. BMP 2799]|nr:hypothetical protein J4E81_008912 [Alternaria sp. BMP 2799]